MQLVICLMHTVGEGSLSQPQRGPQAWRGHSLVECNWAVAAPSPPGPVGPLWTLGAALPTGCGKGGSPSRHLCISKFTYSLNLFVTLEFTPAALLRLLGDHPSVRSGVFPLRSAWLCDVFLLPTPHHCGCCPCHSLAEASAFTFCPLSVVILLSQTRERSTAVLS